MKSKIPGITDSLTLVDQESYTTKEEEDITRDMPSVTDNIKMFTGLDKFEGLIRKYQDNPSMLGILYEELNIVSCVAEELKQDIKQKLSLENYMNKLED